MQENGKWMQKPGSIPGNEPSLVSLCDALRKFHAELPLADYPPNALLSLSDDLLLYLIAAIRNTPCPPPDLSLDDWHHYITLLKPHLIIPLVAFNVQTWPEECRPPREIMEYLNRVFDEAAGRNLFAGRQIQAVTDALRDAGIPVILLKGHALARTLYPDPALRQSGDIDLLVQPRNIPASEEVLEKLGYVCAAKTFSLSPHEHHHEIFFPPRKGMHIELHWALDNAFDLFPDGWVDDAFSRQIPLRSGDLSCDTLSHTDHLLFLAFHNVFQHWTLRLGWVCDLSRMTGKFTTPEDWDELGRLSAEYHIRVPMELSLTAARLWTGCGLPAGAGDFSTWPVPCERELRLLKYSRTGHTSLYSWVYLTMQGQPGIREKLRYGFRFIFPPVPFLWEYRKSSSPADIPLAHLRRWISIVKYL